jgi:hypothetical protein
MEEQIKALGGKSPRNYKISLSMISLEPFTG